MRIGIDIRAAQLGAGRRGLGAYTVSLVEALARTAPEHEYVLVALPDAPLPERVAPLVGPGAPCRVAPLPTPRLPWNARVAASSSGRCACRCWATAQASSKRVA